MHALCFTIALLFISATNLRAEWLRVPLTGTGTRSDMYRPDLPPEISSRSVTIAVGKDGKPLHADCFVWVPDRIDLGRVKLKQGTVRMKRDEALKEIQTRNTGIAPDQMERQP
jgi:hypothetical protein